MILSRSWTALTLTIAKVTNKGKKYPDGIKTVYLVHSELDEGDDAVDGVRDLGHQNSVPDQLFDSGLTNQI